LGTGAPQLPPNFTRPTGLAADAIGNVVVGGTYDPDLVFENTSVAYQTTIGPAGSIANGYLARYSAAGNLAWSLDLSSMRGVVVTNVALDASGNTYALGEYAGQLRINGMVSTLSNSAATTFFLTKVSTAGVPLWTITIEPDAPVAGSFGLARLAVGPLGDFVVQGTFTGAVTFNGATYGTGNTGAHVLVARYSSMGAFQGAFVGNQSQPSGSSLEYVGLALASSGEVFLAGGLSSGASAQFGSLPVVAVSGPALGAGFVVKLDAANNASWQLITTGNGGQNANAIAIGPQGGCYLLGNVYESSMSLGGQTLNTNNPAGSAARDIFLARIAPNGTVESLVGGGGTRRAWGLAIGPQGEASIGTDGGLNWGNVRLPGAPYPASPFYTGVVQLDAAGVPQRGWQATGLTLFTGALAVDGLNRPVLVGPVSGGGSYTLGTQRYTSTHRSDMLVLRTALTPLAARVAAPVAGLEVYPNPARALVAVHTTGAEAVQVRLLDAVGRQVRMQALPAGNAEMSLAGLPPGTYTAVVEQGATRSFRRLTVAP